MLHHIYFPKMKCSALVSLASHAWPLWVCHRANLCFMQVHPCRPLQSTNASGGYNYLVKPGIYSKTYLPTCQFIALLAIVMNVMVILGEYSSQKASCSIKKIRYWMLASTLLLDFIMQKYRCISAANKSHLLLSKENLGFHDTHLNVYPHRRTGNLTKFGRMDSYLHFSKLWLYSSWIFLSLWPSCWNYSIR